MVKDFRFLLCLIDVYNKYAWIDPLKNKKGITSISAFQKNLKESNRKLNKTCVDKGKKLYNRSMKWWLEKNDIEMYSTHNERKSVVAERFIRTLKNKIFKHMTAILKNVYITLFIKLLKWNKWSEWNIVVTSDSYVEYNEDSNKRNPKFKVGDSVRISKYKNTFAKGYFRNWSEISFCC